MPNGPSMRQQLIQHTELRLKRLLYYKRQERNLRLAQIDNDDNSDGDSDGTDPSSDEMSLTTISSLSNSSNSESGTEDTDTEGPSLEMAEDLHYLRRLHELTETRKYLLKTRVLFPNHVHKLSQLLLVLENFKTDDAKRFRSNLRVSASTFDKMLGYLQDDPVFLSTGPRPQLAVHFQLAIALFRFGHFGNGASVEAVAQWAGVSAGCVVLSTRRVTVAILRHHDDIICWPTDDEKNEAKAAVADLSCEAWRDGFCFVDGTLIPLAEKPGFHGEAYYDRKSNYSLNLQLVTLPNLRIIDYCLGHCGSAHDSTAFQGTRAYREHEDLFRNNEWIWADSAYPIQTWSVSPYKRPYSETRENKDFNYWVSRVRVKSEHAVGYLKGRFSSLKGLRQQIDDEQDHRRALEWIRACLVLHTLIFHLEHEPATDITALIESGLEGEINDISRVNRNNRLHRSAAGELKRSQVKRALLSSGVMQRR